MNTTQPLHIFKPGRQTAMSGVTLDFCDSDLAASARAYDPAKHEAPIVIGHAASNKIVLAGTSRFTDKANSDPIGVIEDGKEAVRGKIGRYPNTAVIGAASWKALKQHPQFLERIKYSMKGVLTLDLIKEILEVENIVVGRAIYANDKGVFGDLWGDNIVLAYVAPGRAGVERTPYEPSFGYTLRKKSMPQIDTRTEDGKLELVRNTDNFQTVLLGAEAGYLIADTNA